MHVIEYILCWTYLW